MNVTKIANTIFRVGYHGPYILMVTAILLIIYTATATATSLFFISTLGNKILLVIFWNLINYWLNGLLKRLIKQSRPKKMIKINQQDVANSRGYGMPSGHAQIATNNLVFIALTFRNDAVTVLATLQTLLTIYQRYSFRMHSATQLLTGTAIGAVSGYALSALFAHRFNPLLGTGDCSEERPTSSTHTSSSETVTTTTSVSATSSVAIFS
jgi:membrane-associated phospholipid phosphatase